MPENSDSFTEESDLHTLSIPATIFRAYDIRGIAGSELTSDIVERIAKAIASEALDIGIDTLLIGSDARLSSPVLSKALIKGVLETGCNVIDLGLIPTPILYFATHTCQAASGVMLTASHNPANYNGLKIVFNKTCLADNQIQQIRSRVDSGCLRHGSGQYIELDASESYLAAICSRIELSKPLRLVIDCGNAVPGLIAPLLFERLGCEVIPLFCELDGSFPNHHPDPTKPKNMRQLADQVILQKADLGIAFDGDGDRLGLVTNKGETVSNDKLLMLLVKSIAPLYPGQPIIFDVKSSAALGQLIAELGAVPVMHRSGHSFMKQKMLETNAPLGGEYAAHIFIKDRWFGFDDGLYAAARVVESISQQDHSSAVEFASYKTPISTDEISVAVSDEEKFELVSQLQHNTDLPNCKIILLDGLRAEFEFGWGLVRASNTSPALLLRFEANTDEQIEFIKAQFRALLWCVDKKLNLNF
jgi:phosphomannomutase/phosphoglucomutase